MSKRTPYDTGKRSEPKVWTSAHIEDDDDYGKVDFEDDAGGTLATLYIEQSDDRTTYTLKGFTNESLKIDIDSDEDATVTLSTPDGPIEQVQGVSTIHWFPGDLVERVAWDADGIRQTYYGQVRLIEQVGGKVSLWVLVPGHVEPTRWPANECRLLRRNNPNKEGQ
ncbi:MAG: hypothetical protein ACXVYB_00185 [Arthrobacter sp.]